MPVCSICKKNKQKGDFSRNQLKKKEKKCRVCTDSPPAEEKVSPDYRDVLLKKEIKAHNIIQQKIKSLQDDLLKSLKKYNGVKILKEKENIEYPVYDKNALKEAIRQENFLKKRALARDEVYEISKNNYQILNMEKKIQQIRERNSKINEENRKIRSQNRESEEQKRKLFLQFKDIQAKIASMVYFSNESDKNVRYLNYAIKHGLEVTMENLYQICNVHRNEYIAKKAYEDWEKEKEPPGYSECYKRYYGSSIQWSSIKCNLEMNLKCNLEMNFLDESGRCAKCECGHASWSLSTNFPDDFDITSTEAHGTYVGFSNIDVSI